MIAQATKRDRTAFHYLIVPSIWLLRRRKGIAVPSSCSLKQKKWIRGEEDAPVLGLSLRGS